MLGVNEKKLIDQPWIAEFPLLKVAARIARSCGKCGHKNVNPASSLQVAVDRYAKDPAFIERCRQTFQLPVKFVNTVIQ